MKTNASSLFIARLENLSDRLKRIKHSNDDEFKQIIADSITLLRLTDYEASLIFDVSRPTVTRWKNGRTVPHPAMREALCKKIKTKVNKRLKIEQQENKPIESSSSKSYSNHQVIPMAAKGGCY